MATLMHLFLSLLGLSIRNELIPSTNLQSLDVPVSPTHCGANEQHVTCVNHCNKCVKPPPQACPRICVAGCDCVPGYTRNASFVCIPEEQCEMADCPENEKRSDCVVPCNDCHTRGDCKFLVCNRGCDCHKGYFRNKEGKCVPATECSAKDEKISTHMGGCIEARCVAFCKGYGLRGNCNEAYPGGEKLCLCTK